ncbi:MAG TPA: sulfotransferase [Caulobacteraceae bacterium]|nr:sulfotransferase [Caulobacteraceae bacterium]
MRQSSRSRRRRRAALAPDEINALLDGAAAHYAAGRLAAASETYRRVEAEDPEDVRARYSLAVIDLRMGRFDAARRRLKAVLRRQGDHYAAHHNLGVAEQRLGGWEAAAEAYGHALRLRPDAADTSFAHAIALAVLGRTQEAIALYRTLAERPEARAQALTRLAVLRPEEVTDAELARLQAAAADETLETDARTGLLFALGGVLEARREDGPAWEAFAAGNALKHQALAAGDPSSRPATVAEENAASVQRIRSLFTAPFLARHAGGGEATVRPIFIVGMPRSGSSLIEQILSSHPRVQGMGESNALWTSVEGRFPYPPQAPREGDHFRRLARRYLEILGSGGWSHRHRPVDKTLDNHLHVGMIHLMFPQATILHAVRDPVDTGLACWRQLFATGNETLYDLGEIGAEQLRYAGMMEHWRKVLPGRVVDVRYEEIIADPEATIRWLVTEVCGLPWAADCLRFHETARAVGTASADQVRRPIFRTSVERWRRYEGQLAPLIAALRGGP